MSRKPFKSLLAYWIAGRLLILAVCGLCGVSPGALLPAGENGQLYLVGVAAMDITPEYPVRLTGYAIRKTESEGVAQQLWAKALAISSDKDHPAILITVDNCGVPRSIRDEATRQLERLRHVRPDRVAICSSHTHSGPWVNGFAPNIFGAPISVEEQKHVDRYTHELAAKLVSVALKALDDRRPARLLRGQGTARFAANRRTKDGPVDHDLPVLFVMDPSGKIRSIFASYACHCTTLGGEFNQISGDWAGYAQEYLERDHPGAIPLIALGCAADANPNPRSTLELTKQHGAEIAAAVARVLTNDVLTPVTGKLTCRTRLIQLPFDTLPTRAELELQAKETNAAGGRARLDLGKLDRGEKLPSTLPYLVQTWIFGDGLAMIFLPGEVVVDYSLRLKKEFDANRLWINAYANDVPCYIPSRRIWREGGYEGGGAMIYYDQPTRLAQGTEDLIISAVHSLIPRRFATSSQ